MLDHLDPYLGRVAAAGLLHGANLHAISGSHLSDDRAVDALHLDDVAEIDGTGPGEFIALLNPVAAPPLPNVGRHDRIVPEDSGDEVRHPVNHLLHAVGSSARAVYELIGNGGLGHKKRTRTQGQGRRDHKHLSSPLHPSIPPVA